MKIFTELLFAQGYVTDRSFVEDDAPAAETGPERAQPSAQRTVAPAGLTPAETAEARLSACA